MGQALNVEFPEDGELLRQFLIQDIQKGWSHSESIPNFLSDTVGFDNTRSRHTLHSISWLCFRDSKCFCLCTHVFICSSISWGLKGCKQCFPQVGHKSPWICGQVSPRGQFPAAAKEHIGWSARLWLLDSPMPLNSDTTLSSELLAHAGFSRGNNDLLVAETSELTPEMYPKPPKGSPKGLAAGVDSEIIYSEGYVLDDDGEAEGWDREILTWSYRQCFPYAQAPFW